MNKFRIYTTIGLSIVGFIIGWSAMEELVNRKQKENDYYNCTRLDGELVIHKLTNDTLLVAEHYGALLKVRTKDLKLVDLSEHEVRKLNDRVCE